MSKFDRLSAFSGKAVNRLYGDAILFTSFLNSPAGAQYGAASIDSARPAFEGRGVFHDDPGSGDISGQRMGSDLSGPSRFSDGECLILIMPADVALMEWEPRKGDSCRLIGKWGHPLYKVSTKHFLDTGELVLIVVRDGV